MNADEWAEKIVTSREQYTYLRDKEESWREQVCWTSACCWALGMAGVVDPDEICNAVNKHSYRIPDPI